MTVTVLVGDWIERMQTLPDASVQMVGPTSPPYLGLRDYGVPGQVGHESSPEEFVSVMVQGFREARRVLRPDGLLVLNLGDSYNGSGKGPSSTHGLSKQHTNVGSLIGPTRIAGVAPKNLLMIPFRVAMALQADGWILRSVIPWVKRNPMPESVSDRPTSAIEYLFLFAKSPRYFWAADAIRQGWADDRQGRDSSRAVSVRNVGGRSDGYTKPNGIDPSANRGRSYRNSDAFFATWQGLMLDENGDPLALVVNPSAFRESHFATFPVGLVEPFVRAGTRRGDTVLDPFGGAGTTGLVAERLGRNAVLCELNPEYAEMARRRIASDAPMLTADAVTVTTPEQLSFAEAI